MTHCCKVLIPAFILALAGCLSQDGEQRDDEADASTLEDSAVHEVGTEFSIPFELEPADEVCPGDPVQQSYQWGFDASVAAEAQGTVVGVTPEVLRIEGPDDEVARFSGDGVDLGEHFEEGESVTYGYDRKPNENLESWVRSPTAALYAGLYSATCETLETPCAEVTDVKVGDSGVTASFLPGDVTEWCISETDHECGNSFDLRTAPTVRFTDQETSQDSPFDEVRGLGAETLVYNQSFGEFGGPAEAGADCVPAHQSAVMRVQVLIR